MGDGGTADLPSEGGRPGLEDGQAAISQAGARARFRRRAGQLISEAGMKVRLGAGGLADLQGESGGQGWQM